MRILLAGPAETASLAPVLGDITGLPAGQAPTPVNVLAAQYLKLGHEVTLVTLDAIAQPVSVTRSGLTIVYIPRRKRARDLALSLFHDEIELLTAAYRKAAPDIVHAHWTYEYAEAGVRSGFPLLVTGHDSAWDTLWIERDAYRLFRLFMALRTIRKIRNLTVVAPYLVPHMKWTGARCRPVAIPNGLDMGEWQYEPKSAPGKNPVIVSIGNGYPRKNIGAAVDALKIINKTIPGATLHLFGPGMERFLGIDGVFVRGTISNPDLRNFHRSTTTLLIHPSRQEICPVSIIEAKALGVPVVAGSKSGGVPYVMGDGHPGLVDINNPGDIADAALDLLTDDTAYASIAAKGREDVVSRFDIGIVAKQYLSLYTDILCTGE